MIGRQKTLTQFDKVISECRLESEYFFIIFTLTPVSALVNHKGYSWEFVIENHVETVYLWYCCPLQHLKLHPYMLVIFTYLNIQIYGGLMLYSIQPRLQDRIPIEYDGVLSVPWDVDVIPWVFADWLAFPLNHDRVIHLSLVYKNLISSLFTLKS